MSSIVDKVNREVYKNYPFYKGVKPKVSENAKGEPMQLRVKADPQGGIRSVSGSR